MTRHFRAAGGLAVVGLVSAVTIAQFPEPSGEVSLGMQTQASSVDVAQGVTDTASPDTPDVHAALAERRALATRDVGRSAERIANLDAEAEAARREAERLAAIEAARVAEVARKAAEEAARLAAAKAAEEKAAAERAAAEQAPEVAATKAAAPSLVLPGNGRITSPFGMRTHPITGVYKLHSGTDFAAGDGNAYAAAAGTVSISYPSWAGTLVTISHGNGVQTQYAHLARATVSGGQRVAAGEVVGRIGSAGMATGPHLHFEVLHNGSYVDPIAWLADHGAVQR